ncbi:neuropeptide F receptor [Eurytemora carolleeae]|uniref:neuropeptide F receptor n=1 Tax=Eurytemora carolleeae TaxID=1294199 RepID=UPI000C75C226|nr:neuropeptide F receptor [Eurytemora carolleeae]|eukprot:XP_023320465.1 neuropeptide F receptor-like [Eurytemora affinis]
MVETDDELMNEFKQFKNEYSPDSTRTSDLSLNIISLLYLIIGSIGLLGNILVVGGVICRKPLRTERNLLILNLSISDLWQCAVTMPLTHWEIKYSWWRFGPTTLLCRFFSCINSVSVFVSTLSITAIAIDRYWVICNPHSRSLTFNQGLILLPVLWATSFLMVLPATLYREVSALTPMDMRSSLWFSIKSLLDLNAKIGTNSNRTAAIYEDRRDLCINYEEMMNTSYTQASSPCFPGQIIRNSTQDDCCQMKVELSRSIGCSDTMLYTCSESVHPGYRLLYSTLSLLFQYLLPGIALSIANANIYRTLQDKEAGIVRRQDAEKRKEDILRLRRTKNLMVMIGTIFFICWLPLNIFNLVSDIFSYLERLGYTSILLTQLLGAEPYMIIFAGTHLCAMLCTVINPLLYGYFNENFNKEFKIILQQILHLGGCGLNGNER